LARTAILSDKELFVLKRSRQTETSSVPAKLRRRTVIDTARRLGLLEGQNGRIGGRIRRDLVAAAKEKSGIKSDTELLEYALAKVALEDDFGAKDIDIEF
jgi:hypothetical protein